jgi:hypothetical protein
MLNWSIFTTGIPKKFTKILLTDWLSKGEFPFVITVNMLYSEVVWRIGLHKLLS